MSKDEILAGTLAFGNLTGHTLIPITGFLVAGLTAFYMFRLVILTFLGEHKDAGRFEHLHESPKPMTIPLIILACLSFFAFYSFNPFGASSGWFFRAVERPMSVVPNSVAAASAGMFEEALHNAHLTAMYLSLSVAGLGILLAFATYYWKKINAGAIAKALSPVHSFLVNKWYFDELYQATVVAGTLGLSRVLAWFDSRVIDGVVNGAASVTRMTSFASGRFDSIVVDGIVNFLAYLTGLFGLMLRKVQTGRVQTYIAFVLFRCDGLFFHLSLRVMKSLGITNY